MILSVAEPVSSFEAMGAGFRGFRAEVVEFDPARKLEQARALANKSDSNSLAGESPLKRLKDRRRQRSSGKPGNGEPT